jgi:hypothetical protein
VIELGEDLVGRVAQLFEDDLGDVVVGHRRRLREELGHDGLGFGRQGVALHGELLAELHGRALHGAERLQDLLGGRLLLREALVAERTPGLADGEVGGGAGRQRREARKARHPSGGDSGALIVFSHNCSVQTSSACCSGSRGFSRWIPPSARLPVHTLAGPGAHD